MSSRSGAAAERPICVTGLGRSMGDEFQPLEMLGPEGVRAEIKNLEFDYILKGENISERLINTISLCLPKRDPGMGGPH